MVILSKVCKKCGNVLKDTSKFCSKCGTPYVDEPNTQGSANSTTNVHSQVVTPPVQSNPASSAPPNKELGSKGFVFKLVKWVVIIGIVFFAFNAFCGKDSDEKKAVDNNSKTATTVATIDKSFLGKWKRDNPKAPKDPSSITIKEANPQNGGYEVEIFFYRIADAKGYANLDGNKLSINKGTINENFNFRGTIEKTSKGIRLTIVDSNFEYVKPGLIYDYKKM